MKKLLVIIVLTMLLCQQAQTQHTGIGTDNPQATLDINGTFRIEQGTIVNGISADSMLIPGSDSLLPTQLAVKEFLQSSRWAPIEGETDSAYIQSSQSEALPCIRKVVEKDGMAYVLTCQGFWIYDVSDPDTIIQHDSISMVLSYNTVCDFEIQDSYAYIVTYDHSTLSIYDISDPDHIELRSETFNNYGMRSLVVDGAYAYVLTFNWSQTRVLVYDISNPDSISLHLDYTNTYFKGSEMIEKIGKWLFVFCTIGTTYNYSTEVYRLNALNPDTLILQSDLLLEGTTTSVTTAGNRLYAAQYFTEPYFEAIQVSQTSNLYQFSPRIVLPNIFSIHARGNDLYAAVNLYTGSQAVINFDISGLEPSPRWVYKGSVKSLCAINHFRYIQGSDRLAQCTLEASQDKRDLVRHTDGTLGFQIAPWHTDSLFNVSSAHGFVGIGTENPEAKLHLIGDQRIDGYHTIEFGANIPGKEINAGKIGYGTFSGDALDIVGAGPEGGREIALYGEDELKITGKLIVQDSSVHLGPVLTEGGFEFSQHVGIGAAPTSEQTLLVKDGMIMSPHGTTPPGIWINQSDNIAENANFFGDRGDQVAGIKTSSGWAFMESGTTHNFGIGMDPGTDKLSVGGSCSAPFIRVDHNLLVQNNLKIDGNKMFALGISADSTLGYATLTPQTLDIKGSGLYYQTIKKINLVAEGGTTIDGPVQVADTLKASSISTGPWIELSTSLQNAWVNYGNGYAAISMYKDLKGTVHLRGLVTGGLNQQNTVIVNLPAGYRPTAGHQIFASTNGVNTAGRIDVETDGDVVFRGVNNTFISLDQISFKTN